jgi:hypothetical protein
VNKQNEMNKMKNKEKLYKVKIYPITHEEIYIRVPKGVEINQQILENSSYFDDWYNFEPPQIMGCKVRCEFTEINPLKLPKIDYEDLDNFPSLDEDGYIYHE